MKIKSKVQRPLPEMALGASVPKWSEPKPHCVAWLMIWSAPL